MTDLVQTFRFRVLLVRSVAPGPTLAPPPDLRREASRLPRPAAAGPPGRRRAPAVPASSALTAPGARPPADQLGDGGFAECSGLDLEAEVGEHREGGGNDAVVRRVGRLQLAPVVLKRGILMGGDGSYADTALWRWLQNIASGELPVPRYDGHIEVLDATCQRVVARWSFDRGLPAKVVGPSLNAKTGEVAIEELHVHHEGLRLEATA